MSSYLKNIVQLLAPDARKSLDNAIAFAVARTHHEVDVEHLLLALVSDNPELVQNLCLEAGLQGDQLLAALQQTLDLFRSGNTRGPVLSASLISFIETAWIHASVEWQNAAITREALLATVISDQQGRKQLTKDAVQHALECDAETAENCLKNAAIIKLSIDKSPRTTRNDENGALAKFTHNLTELARNGKLDPVLGREGEIRQMIDVLLRRRQNNPVLTGEAGVGKTALAEGLAQRIVNGSVPEVLKNIEIFTLDMGLLQAGASVKGEFENRLQSLLKAIKTYPQPIILFIDEAHTLIGAGGTAGQNDAANLLKPALARGELRVIAATTWSEYKMYFEKDAALARRFQVVKVAEPDAETATAMLRAMAPMMAKHHNVTIQESALNAAVQLSSRYIAGRQLPDKSVSLLDTSCARVAVSLCHPPREIEDLRALLGNVRSERDCLLKEGGHGTRLAWLTQREAGLVASLNELEPCWQQQQNLVEQIRQCEDLTERMTLRNELNALHQQHAMVFDSVDDVCVADVVAGWTGIPLGRMLEKTAQRASDIINRLQQRVTGQADAISEIAQQVQIAQAGINDPEKPTGVFMLAGPSGVGKTETALALAELKYGGERGLITINMSEYQEAHSVSGLKGSPPGYVGYGNGGVLTEAVRRNPYSVVLLDEVEKAHPDVMELFYQVFDKGWMEDAEGQHINFRNTLIILTSNLASDKLVAAAAQADITIDELCKVIRPDFDDFFRPALMGRIQLIPYLPLSQESLEQIVGLKLDKLAKRISATRTDNALKYQSKVVSLIVRHCQVAQSGARDIDAVINRLVMPILADALLGEVTSQTLMLTVRKGEIALSMKQAREAG
ncbi:type VI secretion system ATPase TssH [Pantoea sp. SS70]|uniref:type VI secretion system ATPase TssH n=1 Tax=Pantoea sp. SS70 TaxID=3024247 RepID=UPI002452FD5C|nr:type VI secretion system ATPase TssH [Pantoea sp. SS70]WGK60104.1 type VI secretion system ATPase TssH [Pantoea sp. SS70]